MKKLKITAFVLAVLMCISLAGCTGTADTGTATSASAAQIEDTTESFTKPETEGLEWANCTGYNLDESSEVKNIILMIGDGMGENIIKNAELVKGSTFSANYMPHTCYVGTDSLSGTTDSAAAATAISCGVKTENQYIGVDENSEPIETIVEFAKTKNLKTGLVATQIIPHATPAGMAAHTNYRGLYNTILKHMINLKINVLLGGGTEYTDTAKMLMRIEDAGYTYIKTPHELYSVTECDNLIGAFAYNDLTATRDPSLTTMTAKALDLLDTDDGFFLMVEASHIDIFESSENMEKTISEMQAFDKCIDYTLKWAEAHPGTLVIVTADHETGGVIVPESNKAEDVTDECFTSGGEHTNADVLLFAAGAQSGSLFTGERIENIDIAKLMRKALNDTYGENDVILYNAD